MQFARTLFIVGDILVLEISLSISDTYPAGGEGGDTRFSPPQEMATAIRNTFSVTISVH